MIDSALIAIIVSSVVGLLSAIIGLFSHLKSFKTCCCSFMKEDNDETDILIEIELKEIRI